MTDGLESTVSSSDPSGRAAELLERLLTDEEFRSAFRRNPEEACSNFDLPDLAEEFSGGGKALHTLEIRESRSSLAGAFMAAASEGSGAIESLRRLHESRALSGDAHRVVHRALTSPRLQAIGHHPQVSHAAPAQPPDEVARHLEAQQLEQPSHGVPQTLGAGIGAVPAHEALGSATAGHGLAGHGDAGLLDNPQLTLSPDAHAGLLAGGGADHRLVSVLTELTRDHHIRVGDLALGHGTGGDSFNILSVDGQRVSPGNIAARDLANELASLDPSHRPAQIVTPWPIDGHGFSTDDAHQDRIHLVFGEPAAAAPAAPVVAAPADPVVAAPADPVVAAPAAPVVAAPAAPVVAAPVDVAQPAQAGIANQSVVLGSVPATGGSAASATLQFAAGPSLVGAADSLPGAVDPAALGGLPDPGDAYPGDGATQQAIAAWMGRQAHKAGLPAELPVMAGLVESGLTNVKYGDRDSLGFFQMRTSVWNEGQYAGFSDHPELQLNWFLNQALAVRRERIANGETSFGSDRSTWGNWVADVEQPAAEYRGRYQLQLDHADGLLTQAGSADPGQMAAAFAAGAQPGGSPQAVQALAVAEQYLGTAYHWGGDTPATGFDCSGLAQYAYSQVGIDLPRVAEDQFQVGIPVSRDQLEPGDLLFFRDSTGYIHHEAIYIGNGQFVHAPHTGDVVKVSSLDEPYYAQQFAGGRRVADLAAGGGLSADGAPAPPPVDPLPQVGAPPAADPSSDDPIFAALGSADSSQAGQSGSTVQFLPAVTDPAEAGADAPPADPSATV